jgi:hypothetical protein
VGEQAVKLYFSDGFVYMRKLEKEKELLDAGVKCRLYSYFHVRERGSCRDVFNHIFEEGWYNLMIDSGAFSVSPLSSPVDVEEYGQWLVSLGAADKTNKRFQNDKTIYVNLDVIPRSLGRAGPDFEKSAEEGWENLRYLESLGLSPIHVFHGGEDWKWLTKLMDNYEYIGVARRSVAYRFSWLDEFWKRLVDNKGRPIRKVHGFALTTPEVMVRYPWYSLDSSSWSKPAAYGGIVIPRLDRGKLTCAKMYVSKRCLANRKQWIHYNTLPAEDKKRVDDFIKYCGFSTKDLLEEKSSDFRTIVNVKLLLLLLKEVSKRKESELAFQDSIFGDSNEY